MFRHEIKLDQALILKLENFFLFPATIYAKSWLTCANAANAANNDLKFYKEIIAYREINTNISEIAEKKFKNHLWYLGMVN